MSTPISSCFITWKFWERLSLKCPLLEISQEILKSAASVPGSFSWCDSLEQYIFLAVAFLLKLKYWLKKKSLLQELISRSLYYSYSIGRVESAWALTSDRQELNCELGHFLGVGLPSASLRLPTYKAADHRGLLQGLNKIMSAKFLVHCRGSVNKERRKIRGSIIRHALKSCLWFYCLGFPAFFSFLLPFSPSASCSFACLSS